MSEKISRLLFEMWMEKNHPYFNMITGLVMLLCILSAVLSVVFVFFFAWWWKMLLVSIAAIFLTRFCATWAAAYFVEQWKERKASGE